MNVIPMKKWHETANWGGVPEHMHDCITDYIENGKIEDDFLFAIVTNDFKGACRHADDINLLMLFAYYRFFFNCVPAICWGDPKSVSDWIQRGGLYGTGEEDEREHA